MSRTLIATSLLGLLAGSAAAQSINIDFGDAAGQPDTEFHGAAGQDGFWNTITVAAGQPAGLRDLGGNSIAATVTLTMPTQLLADNQIAGDNEALLEDGLVGNGDVTSNLNFNGLERGTYDVLIYGFTPTQQDHYTTVFPPAGMADLMTIGGAWPGQFQAGVTHDTFEAIVDDGTLAIEYAGSITGADGFINGVQITKISDSTTEPEDLNGDGSVGVSDLLMLLSSWTDGHGCDGIDGGCPGDFNGDQRINTFDLLQLLSNWG